MIKEIIENWPGIVAINDEEMPKDVALSKIDSNALQDIESISLLTKRSEAFKSNSNVNKSTFVIDDKVEYMITVKNYMMLPATPAMDFMSRWNNNIPMPMATMRGWVEKETPCMVYMHLQGFLAQSWEGWVLRSSILKKEIVANDTLHL